MEEYKSLEKLKRKNKPKLKENKVTNHIKSFFIKSFFCISIFLIALIAIKKDPTLKETIYKHVYENNFSFSKINKLYKKYFGEVIPLENILPKEEMVFKEDLKYEESTPYKNGVKLSTSINYLIPSIESGIVVFIGEKEHYGNTIIIQGVDGVDVWYGNTDNINVKLYDYVEKGTMIAQTKTEDLYLVFQKEGKFLDYKKYI